MEIDQNKLNQIIQILNLEKIKLTYKVELLLYPKQIDEEFEKKVTTLKKELGSDVILRIVEEGEIYNGEPIVPNQS